MGFLDGLFSPEDKEKGDVWVRVCPRCRSHEVVPRNVIFSRVFYPAYVCQSCGFQGSVFPEFRVEDVEKIPVRPTKKPTVSDSFNYSLKDIVQMIVLLVLLWLILGR